MTTRSDVVRWLNGHNSGAGWKDLVREAPDMQNMLIDIVGTTISKGKVPKSAAALDLIMRKQQHINDLDLLLLLGVL